jgi:hypothetical protein
MGASDRLEELNPGIEALVLRLGALLLWVSLAAFVYLRRQNLLFAGLVVVIVLVGLGRWRAERDPDTGSVLLALTAVAAIMLI